MHPLTPLGRPSKSGGVPVTIVATTVGGVEGFAIVAVRSNTITSEAPFPAKRNFPSAVVSMPFGPCNGKMLFPRDPQHTPPTKPPKCPFAPKKPGMRKLPVLHPYWE